MRAIAIVSLVAIASLTLADETGGAARAAGPVTAGAGLDAATSQPTVVGWGDNQYGQLADGSAGGPLEPNAVDVSGVLAGKTITKIVAGSCVIADAQPYCWGLVPRQGETRGGVWDTESETPRSYAGLDFASVPGVGPRPTMDGKTVTDITRTANGGCTIADGDVYCYQNLAVVQDGVSIVGIAYEQVPFPDIAAGRVTIMTKSSNPSGGCALAAGLAYCWGRGATLGDGTEDEEPVPAAVAVATNGPLQDKMIVDIAGDDNYRCALTSDDTIACWGWLLLVDLPTAYVPVTVFSSAEEDLCAEPEFAYGGCVGDISIDGRMCFVVAGGVRCYGGGGAVSVDSSSSSWNPRKVQVAASALVSCALTVEGRAFCWGDGDDGALGTGTRGPSSNAVPVKTDGALAGRTLAQIDSRGGTVCALASDGSPFCWGGGDNGQLGVPLSGRVATPMAAALSGPISGKVVTKVSAGRRHTCAIAEGQIFCWGDNRYSQLGDGTTRDSRSPVAVSAVGALAGRTVTDVAAGLDGSCAIADAELVCWGRMPTDTGSTVQVEPAVIGGALADKAVSRIAMNPGSGVGSEDDALLARLPMCAVADGKAYCWGWTSGTPQPVDASGVLSGKTVTEVSVGIRDNACAIADGDAYCWGQGYTGNDEFRYGSSSPVAVDTSGVLSGKTVTAISVGPASTCVVADAEAVCWGWDRNLPYWSDLLGVAPSAVGDYDAPGYREFFRPQAVDTSGPLAGKSVASIAVTRYTTCALADGTVVCWGMNTEGKLGRNTDAAFGPPGPVDTSGVLDGTTVTAITASADSVLALTAGPGSEAPSIGDFEPTSGPPGTAVQVDAVAPARAATSRSDGSSVMSAGFSAVRTVRVGKMPADFAVQSVGRLGAIVPCGAPSGIVEVATRGGYADSGSQFTITGAPAPAIGGLSRSGGAPGNPVTVSGSGFTCVRAVTFDGVPAAFTRSSATELVATVPAGAATGPVEVTTPGGTATSSADFTVWPYVPLDAPARIADTRAGSTTVDGLYAGGGRVVPGRPLRLPVAGRAGVPAGAATAVLNVTVTNPTAAGFVTVYPCGQPAPVASNLNFVAGQTIPNAVVTPLGGGVACLAASQPTDLVVDVGGYFAGATVFTPLAAPARLADTRPGEPTVDGQFSGGGRVQPGAPLQLTVGGRAGVPVGAATVSLNVTVTEPTGPGYLTVYPCGQPAPVASNLNYEAGQTIPNAVIASLGTGGKVCIKTLLATHVVVDVAGYLADTTAFQPLPGPARLADTRPGEPTVDGQFSGGGRVQPAAPLALTVGGRAGVPVGAATVSLNVTVTEPTAAGYVTVYPCGQTPPLASNLNYTAGQTIPNAVVAAVGAAGKVCFKSLVPTHLVVDVAGYFPG